MSKYYRVTADYRPRNPNNLTYDFKVPDPVSARKMKQYFKETYSWLNVYDVKEITEEETKWLFPIKLSK